MIGILSNYEVYLHFVSCLRFAHLCHAAFMHRVSSRCIIVHRAYIVYHDTRCMIVQDKTRCSIMHRALAVAFVVGAFSCPGLELQFLFAHFSVYFSVYLLFLYHLLYICSI